MNTMQELLNKGFDKTTAINMLDNYTDRIGSGYGCWKLIDINTMILNANVKCGLLSAYCAER